MSRKPSLAAFYLDHAVAREVAVLLRAAGHGASTAREFRSERATDDEQLLIAAERGQIFITHNESDFILLHDAWQRWRAAWSVRREHSGILIVPQGRKYGIDWAPAQIAQEVLRCLQDGGPLANRLYRYKQTGWEHREGHDWIPCP